ncbi:MAG: acetate/propionate family kinase [Bacteroidota bacterium]
MRILVFNSGSSSLKFRLFESAATSDPVCLLKGSVQQFGAAAPCEWGVNGKRSEERVAVHGHAEAARWILDLLQDGARLGRNPFHDVAAIGHRVVHGADAFSAPVIVTDEVLATLESLSRLAPLHNPPALAVMREIRARLGDRIPMVAVFDTAFYSALPEPARVYALPEEWTRPSGIRRYGFHGLAHRYLVERTLALTGADAATSRIITLQLGYGCSITASRGGRPVDTSMGFTPMEGLIMATRPGDVDAGALLHLLLHSGVTADALSDGLNHRAGLLGLSGVSADMQELLRYEAQGHAGARRALQAFCHRARKYLGAYLAVLGGADAVVFGGGVGEHAPAIRARICDGMRWCGLSLDEAANRAAVGSETRISAADARISAYVIPVNEELVIARDVQRLLTAPARSGARQNIEA